MNKFKLLLVFISFSPAVFSQNLNRLIDAKEVERIEKVLSADDMEGRKPGTSGIEKAASFISSEFKSAGLKTFAGSSDYLQKFAMVRPVLVSVSATVNGQPLDASKVMVVASVADLSVTEKSGYDTASIKMGASIFSVASALVQSGKNYLVAVDTTFATSFSRLSNFKRQLFKSGKNVVFILANTVPETFNINATHNLNEMPMANVVGILPGRSKKDEYVVFSGHYDHLGISRPVNGDSIYNGANDDAAGTTGVIMLAKYFASLKNNERTIIFAAFTAEESGGFGSQYFSRQLDPVKVAAMFNIEMIGTESKWGKNSAYITGYEKTNMGEILQKNLTGSLFKFYPDPYTDQQLFYRSDNATLARLGVPAHTISTSKMDAEPNYHKPSDEIGTLDMANMTEIIKAIAISSTSIVAGRDTPSRVDTTELRQR